MRCAALFLLVFLAAGEAHAYTRSRVPASPGEEDGPFLYWRGHEVFYTLNREGSASAGPSSLDAARASFQAWTEPECTDLRFTETEPTDSIEVGYDRSGENANLVVWREAACSEVVPAESLCLQEGGCNDEFGCWEHSPDTIAVTTTTFNNRTGEIVDADIELNGAYFTFSTVDLPVCAHPGQIPVPPACVATDIQNTLTHEIGHVIGLDHVDDPRATMYLTAQFGETEKRSLEADDVAGVCAIYKPLGELNASGSGCGCTAGHGGPLALVPLLLLLPLRRRRGARA